MNRPCILIPVHNRRELTLGCLRTLQANGDLATCNVVIIDDGSTDDTDTLVAAEFPAVEILRGDGTKFWTGAIAFAMHEAQTLERDSPLIWLNDDCRPRPGAIPTLAGYVSTHPDTLAGPACLDATTGAAVPSAFIGRRVITARSGEVIRVDGLSGFCVAVGAQAAEKLGPPDAAQFPHYAGDTAYTLRASRMGFRVAMLGDAVVAVTHHAPAGIPERVGQGGDFRRVFYATNSPYRFRTLFALQQLKYGVVAGTGLAFARAASWIAQFFRAKLARRG